MATPLAPKRSNTAGAVPTIGQLVEGELAINTADRAVYMRVGSNVVRITDGIRLSGTYAARPAATAVPPNSVYVATNVSEEYVSNGTTWSVLPGAGSLLAAAERTTAFTTTTGSPGVDVPSLTFNVVVGQRPLMLSFGATLRVAGAAGDVGAMQLQVDGANVSQLLVPSLANFTGFSRDVLVTGKTPGSAVAVKVTAFVTGGATFTIFGDPTDKSFLYARNA